VGYWAISGTEQTHVWAEFYLEGIGWVPVDPTIGQQSATDKKYYFGNMDNQRVILEKGFNIPFDPPAPDGYLAPLIQGPYFWFWGDGNGDNMSFEVTGWNVTQLPLPAGTTAVKTSTPVTTVTFSADVPGNSAWVDTGLRVTAGQNISISASGTVNTYGGGEGSNSGPNGQTTICQKLDDNSNCIINGAPYGLLVGRIDEGVPFRIGTGLEMAAPASGTLYLMVNDNYGHYDDNSGSYQVTITLR
jgi:hypothetical protein